MSETVIDGRSGVDAALVRRLIAKQFPQWAELAVRPVEIDGWDNRTYRLGDDMSVRLPSGPGYAPQVDKEQGWLPFLAPQLPLPISVPLAKGEPGEGYPYGWSICRWLSGETANTGRIDNPVEFARTLADFLATLQGIDATDGPAAGPQSSYRGASPEVYDEQTRSSITALARQFDTARATEVWEAALAANWQGEPQWFHGDVASGNLLVRDGQLAAVIDFGTCGVGDPACDLTITWTMFSGDGREAYRTAMSAASADAAMWARGRGWALWKALIEAAKADAKQSDVAANLRVVNDVIADHVHATA